MINHPQIVKMFEKSIKNNRLSHLYMLNGLKGSGKKELAYKIASLLFNADVRDLETKGHINLFYIEPEGQSLKTSQIEKLQEEFYKTSLVDGYRVYIIESIDKLTIKSANQLLKFLEEPASKVSIGILLTDNLEKVIDTIKSRSQIINVASPIEKDLKEELLKENINLREAELLPYLNKNIETLLEMAHNENVKQLILTFENFVKAIINLENIWIFSDTHLNSVKYDRVSLEYFLQMLLVFYLDLYNYKLKNEINLTSFKDYYKIYRVDIKTIKENLENIQELIKKLNYNVNIELAFNNYLLSI